ncbi:MAG: glycosyltransferase family 4 protein [bacterium]
MNILYHFRTRGTGPEAVHISGMASAFERLGHQVVFSSPTGVDPRKTAGASPYHDTGRANILTSLSRFCPGIVFELLEIGYNLHAYMRNREIMDHRPFNLIYERHAFFLASTAWLARRRGVPLVVEVNELVGDARVRKQPWLSFVARRLDLYVFRHAAAIVVVSPYLKRRIQALGIPSEKILVLPNAVDAEEYSRQADAGGMKKRLGTEGEIVVGFVGWFVAWHRLDLLVEVFASLAATRPALRLVLVGEGPLRAELKNQISRLGVADRVIFPGALPHQEIPSAIAAMDVCVVPNSNEYRSPIKLFEYMGQGRLVVAPATEPVKMVVRHGENGLLFAGEDKGSLTEVLIRGVDNPAFRDKVGRQARHDVLAHHTWRDNAISVLDLLVTSG